MSHAPSSDSKLQLLIDRLNAGELKVREVLLKHACDRLLILTRNTFKDFPSIKRWEMTDDVLQRSLLRLHKALENVHIDSVAHFFNLAAEHIRWELLDLKKHYYGIEGLGTHHHTDHQPADNRGGSIQNQAYSPDDDEPWEEIHLVMAELPDDERQVVNLLFYNGLTQLEAAELLGISLRTVKRRWLSRNQNLAE